MMQFQAFSFLFLDVIFTVSDAVSKTDEFNSSFELEGSGLADARKSSTVKCVYERFLSCFKLRGKSEFVNS
jgi:hypothetical protein